MCLHIYVSVSLAESTLFAKNWADFSFKQKKVSENNCIQNVQASEILNFEVAAKLIVSFISGLMERTLVETRLAKCSDIIIIIDV